MACFSYIYFKEMGHLVPLFEFIDKLGSLYANHWTGFIGDLRLRSMSWCNIMHSSLIIIEILSMRCYGIMMFHFHQF